jgi:hypothetical protein
MSINNRAYSRYANEVAIEALNNLLRFTSAPSEYRETMTNIGHYLGEILDQQIPSSSKCLVASTAEDADFLSKGVIDALSCHHNTLAAVFWNNHYSIPGASVAPVVHKFLQPGFEAADSLVVVKSVISGSCVVRTNILALIERLNVKKIYIVAPVMHIKAEQALRSEFPDEVSKLFEFVYLAQDSVRDESGEVKPGIGGQIYQLLGMKDQPARTSFMPNLVKQLAAI